MKIMFTGHRDSICNESELDNILNRYGSNHTWIHGGALGFDSQVQNFAVKHGIKTEVYIPDYKTYKRGAPIVRNKTMLAKSILVIACYDGRKSGGTAFVIKEAKKENKAVVIVKPHHHISTQ